MGSDNRRVYGFGFVNGGLRDKSPTLEIPELVALKGISSIHDIIMIRDFVFSTIPWFITPSDKGLNLHVNNVRFLYDLFKAKTAGGWCGLNAEYFQLLLYWYQMKTRPYNFGLPNYRISHVGIIVEYDHAEFFFDPYFGMHFEHVDGFMLTFPHLMSLIADHRLNKIVPVYSKGTKSVQNLLGGFDQKTGEEIYTSVVASWPDYVNVMKTIFGDTDSKLLMMLKIS